MKTKFNLIGGPFQHAKTSTLDKESKYLEWVFESKDNDITFYVDYQIFDGLSDLGDGKKKFGWLLESRAIVPNLVETILNNLEKFVETYDSIFTHDKRLLDAHPVFKWTPAYGMYVEEAKIYEKTKLLSMVTSNKTMTKNHNLRNRLAALWKDKLDLYGRGYNEIEKKEEGLSDYMFSVCIENDCYETYFTEKILDCFATGTIPIYLGAPDISKHFNMDGIILLTPDFDIDSLNEDLYFSKIDAIKENFHKSLEYDVLEDWIFKNYLEDLS